MSYRFSHVACGGTFDLLHKGHKSILDRALGISKKVSIGITTDSFCKEIGKAPYESGQIRKKNLVSYLKTYRLEKRAKIVWLDNIYGTADKDKTLEALVVSKETLDGAKKINSKRSKLKLKILKIIVCPQVLANDGKKISTGRIRSGELSQDGANFKQLLLKIAGRRFSNKIRQKLKKPFGKVVPISTTKKSEKPLFAVGDVSVKNLLKNHVTPDISVVDLFVNRKRVFKNLEDIGFAQPNPDYVIKNDPGQISGDLVETFQKAIKKYGRKQIILVTGEEDLAFIPALLLAPIPATIVYGQPNRGQVKTGVTLEAKNKLCTLLGLK